MKFSIITAVYNNPEVLGAIKSLQKQKNVNFEHIVVDGASDDYIIKLIKDNIRESDIFVSEPDDGIYDALNKGLKLATGDVIGFLHSDDFLASDDVLQRIENSFEKHVTDGIYGDLNYVGKINTNHIVRKWKSRQYNERDIKSGWMLPHPTLFLKRKVYNDIGFFDTKLQIAADYDFILRVLNSKFNLLYIPELITNMRIGGESNKSIGRIYQKMKEDYLVLRKYTKLGIFSLFWKNISKICQFISK